MTDKIIALFFVKGKRLKDSKLQELKKLAGAKNITDEDTAVVKLLLKEGDPAIDGKSYYCNKCGLVVLAKLEACPRCKHDQLFEGKPTLEWVLQKMKSAV